LIGLIFVEIVNERRFTTNGENQEQAFHEDNFMPLDRLEEDEVAARKAPADAVSARQKGERIS
jgi:hypothetical protein